MFNQAKHRMPPEFQQERALHMQRLVQGREKAIQEDARHLALLMRQEEKHDPEELMEHVQYWQFVHEYDRKYYDSVRRLAIELVPEIKNTIPVIPNKQPPGGGTPGGAAPMPGTAPPPGGPPPSATPLPIASVSRMTKTGFMYLIREDGKPHKLMDSFAGDIVMGRQQYLDERGKPVCLRIKREGNVSVSTNSQSAMEANRLQRELPDDIIRTISIFLGGKVKNRGEVATAAFHRYRKTKSFDLFPVSLALEGPSKAILMLYRAHGQTEPPEVSELRLSIGSVMAPYMARLKKALLMDGFDFTEAPSPLPKYVPQPDVASVSVKMHGADRPSPTSTVRELSPAAVESSKDFRSLLMTAVSKDDERALMRLAFVMARYPEEAIGSGICDEDLSHLPSMGAHGLTVTAMAKALPGDDADVMEAYMNGDDFTKACLSQLVVSQDRTAIISAMPDMCITDGLLNVEFFSRLDATDGNARQVILDVAKSGMDCPAHVLGRKLMESAVADSSVIKYCSLNNDSMLYAIAKLAEEGSNPGELLVEVKLPDSDAGAIVATVSMQFSTKVAKPDRIAMLFGKRKALEYMRVARVTWEGDNIPRAADIASSPDNPLPLARGLSDIKDAAGMLVLLYKCAEDGQPKRKEAIEAIRVLVKSLSSLGQSKGAHSILAKFDVRMGPEEADGSLDDILMLIKAGDDIGAALALCKAFETDQENTASFLDRLPSPGNPKLFLEMLPSELLAMSSPPWGDGVRVHAMVLPYGLVATCKSGIYSVAGRHVASSASRAFSACSTVLAQGLGMLPAEHNKLRTD